MNSWEMMAALILRTCESSAQKWGSAGWTPEVLCNSATEDASVAPYSTECSSQT